MPTTVAVLSTYPPTQCGLATFTAALVAHLRATGGTVGVVRLVDRPEPVSAPEVVHHLRTDSAPAGAAAAAAAMNEFDVAIIQHEYGIYGGQDGEQVLAVLAALRVPAIVVLHTVLVTPTPHQRAIIEAVAGTGSTLVTMTRTAQQRLLHGYPVDPAKVLVIPHGATENRTPHGPAARGRRPLVLTWGLLGPGKGIEWAIEAMAHLQDLAPGPRYLVAGQTHPRVLERDGEAYRNRLTTRVAALDLGHAVDFDARYLHSDPLQRMVRQADVIVLPYDSQEQVTSGVLIEAVSAGKPVVSTGFPHAVELLAGGAGLVVPREDPEALARALRRVLTEPGLAGRMSGEARRLAPQLLWPAVADRYRTVADTLAVQDATLVRA
ncbi:MAG TPA: glycosyltransferase [Mycobacteriales bacterium]|nr:glycosyltransferase [Mycobacteriales bacterium]